MKNIFKQSLAALVVLAATGLTSPSEIRADATAVSLLSFTNISITPGAGTFVLLTNWSGAAFAQATLANQFNTGASPAAGAAGDFSTATGSANAGSLSAQSSANASVIGQTGSDNAEGQAWLTSWFMITGGAGDVTNVFSALINGSLSVLTDGEGELALAETIFSLEVSGSPLLFDHQFFSIGTNDSNSLGFSTFLNGQMTLQYDTPYMLFVQADSEVSVSSVPEPATTGLAAAGALGLLWLGRKKKLCGRMKGLLSLLLLLGACGISQATYVGADVPDICQTCGVQPNRLPGGTVAISSTEGNLREDYPVVSLRSGGMAALEFSLTYNSYNADGSKAQIDAGFGLGWTHSYNSFLFQQRGSFFKSGPDGRVTMYRFGTGGYTADKGYFETLSPQPDGSYIITNKLRDWWRFEYVSGTQLLVGGTVYRLTQMGDRNGNTTSLTYSGGLLNTITDTYGRTVTLGYTSGHLATITDPLGRTNLLQYDPKFRTPTRITDPDGKVTRYTYNSLYQLTKKIDRDGRTYFYLYRNLKPWAVVDGDGQTWFSLQNPNKWAVDRTALATTLRRVYFPSTTTSTDGNGNAWRYQYDTNGYITRVIEPDGATTSYVYDSLTRKVRTMTNANGAVTRYQYDSLGNRTNLTDALGNVTTYTYEPVHNQVTSMSDPNGRTTTYQYDSRGNRTKEIDPLGQTNTYTYDGNGNLTTQTDRRGNTTTYIYDSAGNRTNMTDALGNVTTYTYDAVVNQVSTTDANGRTTSYAYDSLSRLVAVTNAAGGITTYTYDARDRRTRVTDPNTNSTSYFYDTRGRLTRSTNALGDVTMSTYDANNNRIAATDELGRTTTYQYDSRNRLITTTNALGGTTITAYDGVGNRIRTTDANDHSTTSAYDALNRVIVITNAIGGVTRYDYSSLGGPPCCSPTIGSSLVTRMEDANGHVTFYKYDELDRLKTVVRKQGNTNDTITPVDAVTTYTYDPVGNRLSVTDPVGNTNVYAYDALNRMVASTNAAGDVSTAGYDPVGNVIRQTSPNGNITTNAYDALNRLTSAYDEIGRLTTNAYDPVGNQVSSTDANGNTTTSAYDGLNRRTNVTDALGRPTITAYDPVSNVITNIDRNGNVTRYGYDALNRRTSNLDALGNTTTYAYDPVGNVTNNTDANGRVTGYGYDGLNRRITEVYPNSPPTNTVTYTYDGVGNRITRTDQKGQVTIYTYSELNYRTNRSYTPSGVSEHFTYDLSGRMLSADRNGWVDTFGYDGASRLLYTTQNGQLLGYIYDIAGRKQTNAYPSGRVIRQTTDGRSRLVTEQEGINPPIVTYTYDAADRVITRNFRNSTTTTYTYDADNRVASLEHSNAVGRVAGFGYAYDFEGNRLAESKRHATGDSEAYVYDALNRLTNYDVGTLSGVTIPSPSLDKKWNLDPLGNWNSVVSNAVTETRTHGPANELLTVNAQTFTYDGDGNLAQDSLYNYSYDEENRITQVQRISDSAIVGRYYYDALGRRVIAIANPAGISTTNVFYYDRMRLVEEQDGAGAMQATYVYGNYIDEVLTMDRGGQVYYYHQNSLWSPHALTDAGGNVVERYTYDAYGGVIVLDASYSPLALNAWGTPHSAVGNPYLFTGRELDEESGLYFYRARHYDPVKGRFLQRDPLGTWADEPNMGNGYSYVADNPATKTDPYGLEMVVPPTTFAGLSDQALAAKLNEFSQQLDDVYRDYLNSRYPSVSSREFPDTRAIHQAMAEARAEFSRRGRLVRACQDTDRRLAELVRVRTRSIQQEEELGRLTRLGKELACEFPQFFTAFRAEIQAREVEMAEVARYRERCPTIGPGRTISEECERRCHFHNIQAQVIPHPPAIAGAGLILRSAGTANSYMRALSLAGGLAARNYQDCMRGCREQIERVR